MKPKILVTLLAMVASNVYAGFTPQTVPKQNEGVRFKDIQINGQPISTDQISKISNILKLPSSRNLADCLVSLPDPGGKTARVARVASRMSAWIGEQTPDKKLPRVYLHREGDDNVYIRGKTVFTVDDSMGKITGPMDNAPELLIRARETASGDPEEEGTINFAARGNEVHYLPLVNIESIGSDLKSYEDGPLDGDRIRAMSFKVGTARPSHSGGNLDSYTVSVLLIRLGGVVRAFGLCM